MHSVFLTYDVRLWMGYTLLLDMGMAVHMEM